MQLPLVLLLLAATAQARQQGLHAPPPADAGPNADSDLLLRNSPLGDGAWKRSAAVAAPLTGARRKTRRAEGETREFAHSTTGLD